MRIFCIEVVSMVKVVEDVFSKGFLEVHENDMLSSCLSLFKKEVPPVLAVSDSEGRYKRGYFLQIDNTLQSRRFCNQS